jgi:hypothetical protein
VVQIAPAEGSAEGLELVAVVAPDPPGHSDLAHPRAVDHCVHARALARRAVELVAVGAPLGAARARAHVEGDHGEDQHGAPRCEPDQEDAAHEGVIDVPEGAP